MKLRHGLHLAYCTNIHRGETWAETFEALQRYALAVRKRVCPQEAYAIGLRLSDQASRELSDHTSLRRFQEWLMETNCYVFTINGFPYGQFHGTRVKEQVYAPDWTASERVEYTNRLFDLLGQLVPDGIEGSASTVPCSFKEFVRTPEQVTAMRDNIWGCVEHIAEVSARTGKQLHLGLEPEPLCYLETSSEVARFFEELRRDRPNDPRLSQHLGVNYDTCHLAVEFEEPHEVLQRFKENGIKISKLHLSSALKVRPSPEHCRALAVFNDPIYFHQVVVRTNDGELTRYRDLDDALGHTVSEGEEWRIHYHIPLHCSPTALFQNTTDHLEGVLNALEANPKLCSHLEMETYTWEVLPDKLRNRDVVDQLVGEYDWTLARLRERSLSD